MDITIHARKLVYELLALTPSVYQQASLKAMLVLFLSRKMLEEVLPQTVIEGLLKEIGKRDATQLRHRGERREVQSMRQTIFQTSASDKLERARWKPVIQELVLKETSIDCSIRRVE